MKRTFAVLTLLTAVAFAAAPFLSSGFNGFAANQFPNPQVNPPIQPAGYAFSIWGLIYLWLIAGTGFGAFARPRAQDWQPARLPLLVSLGVGSFWIAVAQVSVIWATVMIWVMLITALMALARSGGEDRWLQREPVGAYAGWLTAASSVSLGLMLAGYGFTSQTVAAYIGLLLGAWHRGGHAKASPGQHRLCGRRDLGACRGDRGQPRTGQCRCHRSIGNRDRLSRANGRTQCPGSILTRPRYPIEKFY